MDDKYGSENAKPHSKDMVKTRPYINTGGIKFKGKLKRPNHIIINIKLQNWDRLTPGNGENKQKVLWDKTFNRSGIINFLVTMGMLRYSQIESMTSS
jgi:hypothetical protein